jgi:polyhydroxybutyrate depolymerase
MEDRVMRSGLLFMVFCALALTAHAADGLEYRHWTVDGVKREALLHVPPAARVHPAPLIFAFHGHGQQVHSVEAQFAFEKHWPEAIVVYMKGLPRDGRPGWQYKAEEQGGRDLKFFDTVWTSLHRELKVDARHVYAAGFSNGAGFTFLRWATHGDRFVAIATCSMQVDHKNVLPHMRPKPVIHFAGKKEKEGEGIPFEHQVKTVEAFRTLNHCGDGQPWQKHGTLYPSPEGTPVVFVVHGGGHTVPPEAHTLIVRFFEEHGGERKDQGKPG